MSRSNIISVMQWNVWINEDPVNTASLIRRYGPDVACLQELTISHHRHGPGYLASLLGYHMIYLSLPTNDARRGRVLANAILSRYPIIATRTVLINEPQGGGGYDDEYRGYVEATIELSDGAKVSLGTTHMSYTSCFEETDRKREETARLLSVLGDCRQRRVLTGDLNSLPGSYTVDALSEKLQHVGPDWSEPTWTTKPFNYRGFEANSLEWRLDYVFASENLAVVESRIVETPYSDHLPVWCQLRL